MKTCFDLQIYICIILVDNTRQFIYELLDIYQVWINDIFLRNT